ncbi:unnamed protein product [Urochloa decumbens]|uniref:RWP-RK domain-containing protein n=1 Tax=Urochloa decumbens TaxID=240449 RepID=A0ABC9GFG5_9POAL
MPSSAAQRQHPRAAESISRKKKCSSDLVWFIHLPMRQAAVALGTSSATIKRICRRNGVQRWPARKIGALDRRIAKLEKNMSMKRPRAQRIKTMDEWKKLTRQRMDIYCDFMSSL